MPDRESDAPLPASYRTERALVIPGVPYAHLPGARALELDLYLPLGGEQPAPGVVFLHGGGWRIGSRHGIGPAFTDAEPPIFERLAAAGIAVASVDYRLSGEALWPAQLHDAKTAVRWLRTRGPEVGLDPARIAAWGESAGGHLAAMLGLTGDTGAGERGGDAESSRVDAVCAWYPPTELLAIAPALGADPDADDSREALLLGGPPTEHADLAREASPITYARADAPPFLLLHGDADRMVPYDQSTRLRDRLAEVGAAVELVTLPGADHMWRGTPAAAEEAVRRTIAFLRGELL